MNTSLKPFNTFGIQAHAARIVQAESVTQLVGFWQDAQKAGLPVLIIGGGSNILLLEDFSGIVIINRIRGIKVIETEDDWLVHVGAGENWHHLVEYTLEHNMPGLENLALIPGCVGSSPIQNIGAYGVELQSVCDWVDCVDLTSGVIQRLAGQACRFGYRDSVFKHEYQHGYAIVGVGLRLKHAWEPTLTYGDLARLDPGTVTPCQVFDAVCEMRTMKLPDPAVQGNAGSFFKNPVVSADQAAALLANVPDAPHYSQPDGSVKLAAGWLIDRCGLKGFHSGRASVHHQQALVLVNTGGATGEDILHLAHHVRQCVADKFNVWLEPEVRFIGRNGEVNAVEAIA